MDPIGLITSLKDVCIELYKISNDAIHAKDEIKKLSDELLGLRTSLDHSQTIMKFAEVEAKENPSNNTWKSSRLLSSEYERMLNSTCDLLKALLDRLNPPNPNKLKNTMQKLTWHWQKEDFQHYLGELERRKTWFMKATLDDNMLLNVKIKEGVKEANEGIKETIEGIKSIKQTIESQDQRVKLQDAAQAQERVGKWLAPHSTEAFYRDYLKKFEPGTGKWFLDGESYRKWIQSDGSRGLWLKASSGFGKTMLLTAAVENIENIQKLTDVSFSDTVSAYWFCSLNDQASRKLDNILGGLICQLSWLRPALISQIDERRASYMKGGRTSEPRKLGLDELEDLLIDIVKDLGSSYLFIDACNESEDAKLLIKTLNRILSECNNIHVLISSVEIPEVTASSFETVPIGENANADDIQRYIEASLTDTNDRRGTSNLRDLEVEIKAEITTELRKGARDSFRWVDCQLQVLSTKRSVKKIREALHSLPDSLEKTYLEVLNHIPNNDDREYSNRLLFWLQYAYRPLRLKEICEAVILEEDEDFDPDERLRNKKLVLGLCPSLISYNETKQTLSLGHASVYEFLGKSDFVLSSVFKLRLDPKTASRRDKDQAADTRIARICLSYLMQPEFSSGWVDQEPYDFLGDRLKDWPLLSYIADTLWDHLSYADIHGPVSPLLRDFLASHKLPRGGNFGGWAQAFYRKFGGSKIVQTTPLYWAARTGHLDIIRIILRHEGREILEQPGGYHGSTPLHVACYAGNTEVVQYLINEGANVYEQNRLGETGLDWAKRLGHTDIVKMLEDKRLEKSPSDCTIWRARDGKLQELETGKERRFKPSSKE